MIYRTHRANVSGEYIHLLWISCCRPSNESKPPSFEFRRIVKKYPIKYVRLNGKSHKPLQRYRKFLRKREFVKNSYARIEYLCITLPDFGCTHSGFLTVWIASGEKKFRLFLFFIADCQKLSKLWGYFVAK